MTTPTWEVSRLRFEIVNRVNSFPLPKLPGMGVVYFMNGNHFTSGTNSPNGTRCCLLYGPTSSPRGVITYAQLYQTAPPLDGSDRLRGTSPVIDIDPVSKEP